MFMERLWCCVYEWGLGKIWGVINFGLIGND